MSEISSASSAVTSKPSMVFSYFETTRSRLERCGIAIAVWIVIAAIGGFATYYAQGNPWTVISEHVVAFGISSVGALILSIIYVARPKAYSVLLNRAIREKMRSDIAGAQNKEYVTKSGVPFHTIFSTAENGKGGELWVVNDTPMEVLQDSHLASLPFRPIANGRECQGLQMPDFIVTCAGYTGHPNNKSRVQIKISEQTNCWDEQIPYSLSPNIRHCHLPFFEESFGGSALRNAHERCLKDFRLYEAFQDIDRALNNKQRVYIHCIRGHHRSAAVAIAYLASRSGLPFEDCHRYLGQLREIQGFGYRNKKNQYFDGKLMDAMRDNWDLMLRMMSIRK